MKKLNFLELTNTYSIVAFDPIRKQLGVGMQTHNFAACNRVIWAEPGIGAVASQSYTNPLYGYEGIKMMHQGKLPKQILKDLTGQDEGSEYRQIGIIDTKGNIAAHTGSKCIGEAGHRIGRNYSCQANMMLKDTVWDAMGRAFESCDGELVDCIMSAMESAESEGGDIRGAQSAAIMVVTSELTDKPWSGYIYDFKVYDNQKPLKELQRLIDLKKSNDYINDFHNMICQENLDNNEIAALIEQFNIAVNKIPDSDSKLQHKFYYTISLLKNGFGDEAIPLLKSVFTINPVWKEVAVRIAKTESNEYLLKIINSL